MISVSKLTLGTAQLGSDYGIANSSGKPGSEESLGILRAAFRGGITNFDTAYSYGDSESVIGSFVVSQPDDSREPVIISKLPKIGTDRGEGLDDVCSLVRGYVSESLKRLNLKKIPVYLLHNALNAGSRDDKVMKALSMLKDEGLIGEIGVSVYHPEEAERAMAISEIEVIQLPVSLFDQRFLTGDLLSRLAERMTVFTRSVFLQGVFFLDPEELPPYLEEAKPFLEKLKEITRTEKKDPDEVALSFIKSQPEISSVVVGAETEAQVLRNAYLADRPAMDAGTIKVLRKEFSGVPHNVVLPYLWKK